MQWYYTFWKNVNITQYWLVIYTMRPSSVFDHTLFLGVYIGKSPTTYCLTKLARLSSPLWTQSATTGSLKLPRLKNPWSHGESNSSKKVWNKGVLNQKQLKLQTVGTVLMMSSASPPLLTLAVMSGVFMNAFQKKIFCKWKPLVFCFLVRL